MVSYNKRILLLLICFFISGSLGVSYTKTDYPEPGRCETDEDCVKGKARCIRRECHCIEKFAVGDGKTKCETSSHGDRWLGCPKEMYSTHDQCGEPGSFPMPAYRDSYCVWRVNGHAPRMCKCFPGYFGRAGLPFCMSAKVVDKDGHPPCITDRNCNEFAKCLKNKCYCNDGYLGNGDKCLVGEHGQTACSKDSHCPFYSSCVEKKCKCKGDLVGTGGFCEPAKPIDCTTHEFCGADASCINKKCICKGKTVGNGEQCRDYQPCPKGKNYCGDSKVCLIDPLFPDKCAALDECEKQGTFCPRLSTCEKNGTYDCICIKGLRMVNKGQDRTCEDIDECKENKKACPDDAVCQNTFGGHECICKKDHRLDWTGKCVLMNECDKRGKTCPFGSNCKAIPSQSQSKSYDCFCGEGFKTIRSGEKVTKCEDNNECLTGESKCSGDRCKNTMGSYTCVPCLPGFTESKNGHCVGTIKGACNCDSETEDCRYGKCRCKRGHKRNKQGRCVLPPGFRREVKPTVAASQPSLSSYASVLLVGLVGCLSFTTQAVTSNA